MIRVLLTSFEPFDGRSLNSSLEVGRAVAAHPPPGVALDWLVLPVVAGVCVARTWERIEQGEPALVLALGQAAGAAALHIEEQAVNVNHFDIPDNAGQQPRDQPIHPEGPALYRTTIVAQVLRDELRRRSFPAELSSSAGTYVCNHLLYGLLHQAALTGRKHQTGFIHLPILPEQQRPDENLPSLPLEQLAEGIRVAIAVSLQPAV